MDQFSERAKLVFAGVLSDKSQDILKLPNQWENAAGNTDKSSSSDATDRKDHEVASVVTDKSDHQFKKPLASNYSRQPTPGYKLSPKKWTEYHLSDVKLSGDKSNKQSALSFIDGLKERKRSHDSVDQESDGASIKYRKPALNNDKSETESTSNSNFAVVMPEYTIGKKMTKPKRKSTKSTMDTETITLAHLQDCQAEAVCDNEVEVPEERSKHHSVLYKEKTREEN